MLTLLLPQISLLMLPLHQPTLLYLMYYWITVLVSLFFKSLHLSYLLWHIQLLWTVCLGGLRYHFLSNQLFIFYCNAVAYILIFGPISLSHNFECNFIKWDFLRRTIIMMNHVEMIHMTYMCVCVCVLCVCIFIYTHMDCAYVTLPLGYYFSSWDKVL